MGKVPAKSFSNLLRNAKAKSVALRIEFLAAGLIFGFEVWFEKVSLISFTNTLTLINNGKRVLVHQAFVVLFEFSSLFDTDDDLFAFMGKLECVLEQVDQYLLRS